MKPNPTTYAKLRILQRFWNNQLIITMAKALEAVDLDQPRRFARRLKRLDEIKMRLRKDFELPFNVLVGSEVYP